MNTSYMKRSLMLLGAVACMASASAEGTFVDVTKDYLKEPCYLPGWQGVTGPTAEGVCEGWNGPMRLYQVFKDMPAGEYTLTANALYRCGNNDFARENMPNNPDLYKAYIFINDAKQKVAGLFDDGRQVAPNSMAEANAAFENGEYVNTLTVNHPGGDMIVGLCNTGCYWDEWCCFDNFKLVGPDGEVAIENGDFSTTIESTRAWNNENYESKVKTPDIQKDGQGSGDYRKCGGSPYKYGQQVDLPAGTYRFSMLTFHRYGSELDAAGNYYNHKWPCDIRLEGAVGYGDANRSPKDWFEANDYDTQTDYAHAYIFMSRSEVCPKDMNWEDDLGDLNPDTDKRTRIKDCWEIFNGDLAAMPHNNPVRVAGNEYVAPEEGGEVIWKDVIPYETENKVVYRSDSGNDREAGAAFISQPEKFYQYVEFTLDEPAKVWVGMGKNAQTGDGYWHAWADQKLEMLSDNAGVASAIVDENAPEVYYNLQGVRVANPSNGIFIVKKGNKVSKQVIK